MRIISGKYKSRKLLEPGISKYKNKPVRKAGSREKEYLRPTSDRAKETLLDILSNKIDFSKKKCLDLFAGTGALGFECISRGAEFCDFVDNSPTSVQIIQKNAAALNCGEKVRIFKQSVFHFLPEHSSENYDLIFADPPYTFKRYKDLIELVLKTSFSIFVIEHDVRYQAELDIKAFDVLERRVGNTMFTIIASTG